MTAPPIQTLNAAIAKVAGQTGIAADPAPVAPPVVQIVRDAPPASPTLEGAPKAPLVPGGIKTPASVPTDAPPAETPADSSPADASASPPAASAAPTEPVEPTEPTGELSLDEGTLILRAERNADGTFKAKFDPTAKLDFEIIDKTTGEKKAYSKTLPEVVRLAKDGVALQAKVQTLTPEVEYYREHAPKWAETHDTQVRQLTDVQQQLADMAALNRELLSAPDEVVIRHREEFAKANSPQERLDRLERERAEERRAAQAREQSQALATKAQTFVQSKLAAAIEDAKSVYDMDTIMGRLTRITQPLMVRGRIPPERWTALEQEIKGPFTQWVAEGRAKKAADEKRAADLAASTRSAQTAAQIAVNGAGSATAPVGRAAPDHAPAPQKPKNVKEAMDRLINRPLPQTVGAGP